MYAKINWTSTMLLTPARFRQMETQYDEVVSYWTTNPFRMLTTSLIVEVAAAAPAHGEGRIYHNSTDNKLYISDGTNWIDLMEGL